MLGKRVEATRQELQAAKAAGATIELTQLHKPAVELATAIAAELKLETARAVEWIKHVVSLSYELSHVVEPIAYLGPIYSYSYLAAAKHFGMASHLVPVATIAAVFDELIRGQAAFGVVPIENSTDGRVVDTLGMFARLPVKICGEVMLPIHHCLLGRSPRAENCRDLQQTASYVAVPRLAEQTRARRQADRDIEHGRCSASGAEKPGAAAVASSRSRYSSWPGDHRREYRRQSKQRDFALRSSQSRV